MFIFLSFYLIIGIVVIAPLFMLGMNDITLNIEEMNIGDKELFMFGIGMLSHVIIWPYWLGKLLYNAHIKNDE